MTDPLAEVVAALECDRSLEQLASVRGRVAALDRLEVLLDAEPGALPRDAALVDRALAQKARLEEANTSLFRSLRRDIQAGRGASRLTELAAADRPDAGGPVRGRGYDYLDVLVGGVLALEDPGVEPRVPVPEMVAYQPTPARHIFDLIGRTELGAEDVLVDLGSGLGHVSLLVAACTRARAVGIELEPAHIDCARRSARGLNLTSATFVQDDARAADLSDGTVFYLFTPFTGSILRTVLDSLHRQARSRAIRVCTLGPCSAPVAQEAWLEPAGDLFPDRTAVFRSGG